MRALRWGNLAFCRVEALRKLEMDCWKCRRPFVKWALISPSRFGFLVYLSYFTLERICIKGAWCIGKTLRIIENFMINDGVPLNSGLYRVTSTANWNSFSP
jgi:hypothetical protein